MKMKKAVLSLSIIAILPICMFNSVAAAPVSKQTTNVHSNYAKRMGMHIKAAWQKLRQKHAKKVRQYSKSIAK
ncbi:MAG: hypothetical protein WCE81_00650 [Halobacteriota archaeon]